MTFKAYGTSRHVFRGLPSTRPIKLPTLRPDLYAQHCGIENSRVHCREFDTMGLVIHA